MFRARHHGAILVLSIIAATATPMRAVADGLPSAIHEPTAPEPAAIRFVLPTRAARTIALAPVDADTMTRFKAEQRASAKPGTPLRIGFARDLAAVDRELSGATLPWIAVSGGYATKIDFNSPGAQGLRLGLRSIGAQAGVTMRFVGSIRPDDVFEATAIEASGTPIYWGPVTQGDTQTLEISVASGTDRRNVALRVDSIMHLDAFPGGLMPRDIGDSGSCEQDIVCKPNPSQQFLDTAKAVARITFVSGASSFLCSGTLVNNNQTPRAQTFVTANHCVNTQAVANTVTSYWFFDATGCRNNAPGNFRTVQGGATLLFNDTQRDHSLLQIRGLLPAGVVFAGWTPQPVGAGTAILGIHHPAGDLKKYSEGTKNADVTNQINLAGPFHQVVWNLGVTEGGSSGSGLFIFNPQFNNYQLIGQLLGGSSFCSAQSSPDVYGRFQDVFANTKRFLDTPAPSLTVVNAASFKAAGVAAEELVTGFGAELPVAATSATAACQTELAGRYSVSVIAGANRFAACVLFIGARQVNFSMPKELAGLIDSSISVEVFDRTQNRILGAQSGLRVTAVSPGVFTATANGIGLPAANLVRVKPNGQQIFESVANTADPRQPVPVSLANPDDQLFLVLYPTGVRGRAAQSSVKARIAGFPAEVAYADKQGTFTGLDQVNILIPRAALVAAGVTGKASVELTIDQADGSTIAANPVDLYFN